MIYGIIPARVESSRFPNKIFAKLRGIPLVLYTYYNVVNYPGFQGVYLATDSISVEEMASLYDIPCILTGEANNGTERCAEAAKLLGMSQDDTIVNIQADEPFVNGWDIDQLLSRSMGGDVTTLATRMSREDARDENNVKIALTELGRAIYFSRSMIPHNANRFYYHIGIYAYSKHTLDEYRNTKESQLEKAEKLEQLRFLTLGYNISVRVIDKKHLSINTKKDLIKARKMLSS